MSQDSHITIEFKARHDHVSERMKAHAAKKLARLAHFSDFLAGLEVVADHATGLPEVELIAHMRRGKPILAKGTGKSFSSVIDDLADKLEAQLRKRKEKRTAHR